MLTLNQKEEYDLLQVLKVILKNSKYQPTKKMREKLKKKKRKKERMGFLFNVSRKEEKENI